MKSLDKGQFSKSRYAILFEASATPHEVDVRLGYYTSVYGLGRHPSDTKVLGVESHVRLEYLQLEICAFHVYLFSPEH